MYRLDLLVSLGLVAVALEVTLHGFLLLLLLLAEERFHSMTEELTAGFSPILAFLVGGFKELWRQANGDLDDFTHAHFSYANSV
jgi:hypothetical protein